MKTALRTTVLLLSLCLATAGAAPASRATPEELAAAEALLKAGRYEESRAAFEKILVQTPDDPEANHRVGLFACDRGEWERGLLLAGKAIASDPNCARYHYGWAAANGIAALRSGIFSKLGYAKKSLAAYERTVELEPNNLKYRRELMGFYQQAPGFAGGDMAKAYAQAAAIKQFDPENGRLALAQLYAGEKKFDRAFGEFEEALRQNPADYAALHAVGRLAAETGQRLDQGIASLQRCLALPPPDRPNAAQHDNVHWRLGLLWEKKNDLTKARAAYAAALQINPACEPAKKASAKLGELKR